MEAKAHIKENILSEAKNHVNMHIMQTEMEDLVIYANTLSEAEGLDT